ETADLITAEILDRVDGPFAVYGHCAGSALAVAVAQRTERQGRRPAAVYVGGALPSTAPAEELQRARHWPADALHAHMKALGGFDGALDATDLHTVLEVLRHDMIQGLRFQTDSGRRQHPPLDAPLVVVIGDEDAATRGYAHAHRDWKRYAAHVELAEIPGGGHYFVTHQPRALAAVIAARTAAPRPPARTRSTSTDATHHVSTGHRRHLRPRTRRRRAADGLRRRPGPPRPEHGARRGRPQVARRHRRVRPRRRHERGGGDRGTRHR